MAGLLTSFLRDAAARPFEWGQFDCALMIADWVGRVKNVTLAEDLRGSYATETDCHALLADRRGLFVVVGRIARQAGLAGTASPQPGDIGIVRTPEGKSVCAIKVNRGWAMKTEKGLAVAPLNYVQAWRVEWSV